MQSKYKQKNVNIADETLTDYSFLSRYHYTKSKNYLKRRYRIRHWIPMFFWTPCIFIGFYQVFTTYFSKEIEIYNSIPSKNQDFYLKVIFREGVGLSSSVKK